MRCVVGRKLVPSSDQEFLSKAEMFSRTISNDPARFALTQADVEAMTDAAAKFRAAYQGNLRGAHSRSGTRAKNEARAHTKAIFTRLMNILRISESVSAQARWEAGIKDRPDRLKSRDCPQTAPRLRFLRAMHESGATPMHELEFRDVETLSKTKPEGAVRIELFADLIPPDEPIPARPGANHGGRPWYLRSYTRSPIVLTPPMARVPMRVVYWARWADSTGNVGPFSAAAAAWIEGGSHALLPGGTGIALGGLNGPKPVRILEDATTIGPAGRDSKYIVALLEVQSQTLNPQQIEAQFVTTALPAPTERETRRLEGPPASEAA